jgi:hypothetical protein
MSGSVEWSLLKHDHRSQLCDYRRYIREVLREAFNPRCQRKQAVQPYLNRLAIGDQLINRRPGPNPLPSAALSTIPLRPLTSCDCATTIQELTFIDTSQETDRTLKHGWIRRQSDSSAISSSVRCVQTKAPEMRRCKTHLHALCRYRSAMQLHPFEAWI